MEAGGIGVDFFFSFAFISRSAAQRSKKKKKVAASSLAVGSDSAFIRPALCLLRRDLISHCL